MSIECFVKDCKDMVVSGCSCSSRVYMCAYHASSHLYTYGNHIQKKFTFKSSNHQDDLLINTFKSKIRILKENIKELKFSTIQKIKDLIIEKNSKIKEMKAECEFLNTNLIILSNNTTTVQEIIREKNHLQENDVKTWTNFSLKNFSLKQKSTALLKSVNNFFRNKAVYSQDSEQKNQLKLSKDDDKYAIIFESYLGSTIRLLDLDTFKQTSIDFKFNYMLNNCLCCRIDSNKYLVYGGYSPYLPLCNIIDIKNKTIKELTSHEAISHVGGCLFNQDVYVFGGKYCRGVANCKKFNLNDQVWCDIQSLPEVSHCTSAFTLNHKIYITGYHLSKILTYEPSKNRFLYLAFDIEANCYKYLIENWLVSFGTFLYELDKNENLIKRQSFGDYSNCLNSSAYFKKGKFIYFVHMTQKLYRICTEKKKIESINYN